MNSKIKIATLGLGSLLLAACQQAAETENAALPDNGAGSTNYVAEVMALDEPQRLAVMVRAIRDAGLQCQQVTSAVVEEGRMPTTWRATCQDGSSHLIAMQPNGDAQVTSAR